MRFQGLILLAAASLAASCTVNVVRKNVEAENMQEEDEPSKPKPTASASAAATATATTTSAPTASPEGPKICTRKGCFSSLRIDLLVGKAGWSNGAYTIDVVADGKKAQCQVKVPLDCKQTAECTGDAKVALTLAGCDEADAKQRKVEALVLREAPAEVKVTLKRAAKTVGEQTYKPEYKVITPNGPDCEPTCKMKQEELCIEKCRE
jgi:hypothetical protein